MLTRVGRNLILHGLTLIFFFVESEPLITGTNHFSSSSRKSLFINRYFLTIHIQIKISEAKDDEPESTSEPSGPPDQSEPGTSTQKSNSSKWKVIKTCLTEIYSVFVTLFGKILRNNFSRELISIISVTLSVFPGVCASIQSSSDDDFSQKWFSPILTMLLYNFGDTLGRLATAMIQINKRNNSFKICKIEILSQII